MASANQTIGDEGGEFEADDTQRQATLLTPSHGGRTISNSGANPAIVSFIGTNPLTLAQPAGIGNAYLAAGSTVPIPPGVTSIEFLAAAGASKTYLTISPKG